MQFNFINPTSYEVDSAFRFSIISFFSCSEIIGSGLDIFNLVFLYLFPKHFAATIKYFKFWRYNSRYTLSNSPKGSKISHHKKNYFILLPITSKNIVLDSNNKNLYLLIDHHKTIKQNVII